MTTHPEVPQATAREAAVEVMARAMYAQEPGLPFDDYAAAALDALLAATQDEPCATCGGTGYWTATRSEVAAGAPPPPAPFNVCAVCNRSGRVPGAPLVILGPVEEKIVEGYPLGREHRLVSIHPRQPVFRAPFIEATQEES